MQAHNDEMHGAPQTSLPFIVAGWAASSVEVKKCSTGARDLNAVTRLITRLIDTGVVPNVPSN